MNEVWLPLGTALIGALAALAGTVIGPWVGARQTRQQWLLDKRTESYEQFFGVLREIEYDTLEQNRLMNEYGLSEDWPLPRLTDDELDERSKRLFDASNVIQLYASDKLRAKSLVVSIAYGKYAEAIMTLADERRCQALFKVFRKAAIAAETELRHELTVQSRRKSQRRLKQAETSTKAGA